MKRSPSATAAPKPTPALTPAAARDALAHYSKMNNLARMSKDRELLDTVEGGPQHAMSLADLKEEGGLPKADRKPYRPWAYILAKTDVYIPRLAPGKQRWFAAVTRAGTKEQLARVLVLAQNTETKQWEMVSTVDIDDPQNLPQILLDADGYATAVDPASPKLSAPVGTLRSAVGDNFTTGVSQVFTPTKASERQAKVHRTAVAKFGKRGTTRFTAGKAQYPGAYALKTATGTLVIFSHTHVQDDAVAEPGLRIVPEKYDRAWLGTTPSPAFTYTFTCSDIAAVPAAAGPSSLLGYGCRRTDAKATGPSTAV
ncbi:hypothetical protein [Streptomyces sp. NPDC026589]|uniref:hypothetical protein n=1 Tax=Streptomyces TaxID=1883 RepID=UPI0033F6CAD5|nr:hypothetical protein OHB50_30955 [Streptomyces anulatus]